MNLADRQWYLESFEKLQVPWTSPDCDPTDLERRGPGICILCHFLNLVGDSDGVTSGAGTGKLLDWKI
jgi:hypothetical protein